MLDPDVRELIESDQSDDEQDNLDQKLENPLD